ncbi:MAG: TetR family transcriptional regulator [Sphingomonadales bacterium]|jgi:TetR/AcrR family transcriptional repressor of the ameABC operon|nr:TetR family transcriptional regulator [Sphingomonadales bacterium]MBK9004103.1 TetR family transcriptional regulator [Sphingomonadales bacterium]MBK9269279.1 TetR family transcriptional regulator [Sphingomonadales bacterium]MBP6433887.1 TetR family transcriptional regulator [Sphingorhabdus sp.]
MARPQTDIEAGRQELLDICEQLVRQRGGVDLSMTELAAAAGMSPANLYRFFENKEALMEAAAGRWFAPKIAIMEEVVAADLPSREKMFQFFVRRFVRMRDEFHEDPDMFKSYLELGNEHFEVVKGYVDLGDHYLSELVVQAMDEGYLPDLSIDDAVSLINQMVVTYCNPEALIYLDHKLSEEKLGMIIDAIFIGLGRKFDAKPSSGKPHIKIVT